MLRWYLTLRYLLGKDGLGSNPKELLMRFMRLLRLQARDSLEVGIFSEHQSSNIPLRHKVAIITDRCLMSQTRLQGVRNVIKNGAFDYLVILNTVKLIRDRVFIT